MRERGTVAELMCTRATAEKGTSEPLSQREHIKTRRENSPRGFSLLPLPSPCTISERDIGLSSVSVTSESLKSLGSTAIKTSKTAASDLARSRRELVVWSALVTSFATGDVTGHHYFYSPLPECCEDRGTGEEPGPRGRISRHRH